MPMLVISYEAKNPSCWSLKFEGKARYTSTLVRK